MMDHEANILITGGGGSVLTSVLPQLDDLDNFRVFIADAKESIAVKHICDNHKFNFIKVPKAIDPNYINFMVNYIRGNNINYLVPLVDEELPLFHDILSRKDISIKGVSLPKNRDFLMMCLNKSELMKSLANNNFAIPLPVDFSKETGVEGSFIAKPCYGRGSRGIFNIKDRLQYECLIKGGFVNPSDYLLQEKVEGVEYTISVVKSFDDIIVVPKRIIEKRGVTISAVTEENSDIEKICQSLVDVYKPDGCFNVQLIRDKENGEYKIIEINPRLSTSTALTYASGINELLLSLGMNSSLKNWCDGVYMYRYYDQIFVNSNENKAVCYEKKSSSIWG